MKKVLAAVLSLTLTLSLAACGGQDGEQTIGGEAETEQAGEVQISNPFTDYDTLDEAEQAAGFTFSVPESIDGYDAASYRVMNDGDLLEVIYQNDSDALIARKGPGDNDISGDYNEYAVEAIADKVELPSVTFRGDNSKWNLALWTDSASGYTYSFMTRTGMARDAFEAIVNTIQEGEAMAFGTEDYPISGGWTVNSGELSMSANPNAMAAFEKAVEGLSGYSYEPLVLLGTQVVAGTNYRILCRGSAVVPDPVPTYEIITVYEDLNGNAEITDTTPLPGLPETMENLPGGWTLNDSDVSMDAHSQAQAALDTALEGLAGAGYEAAVYLADQIVAGTNYLLFCRVTPVVPNPVPSFEVVTVYADLDGNAEITDMQSVGF